MQRFSIKLADDIRQHTPLVGVPTGAVMLHFLRNKKCVGLESSYSSAIILVASKEKRKEVSNTNF
jgi:hypothetical protein